MTPLQRTALIAADLDWAVHADDVWAPLPPSHVDGLHADQVEEISWAVASAAGPSHQSPVGVVLIGQMGAGKTHLLREIRDRAQTRDCYFFLLTIGGPATFWASVARAVADGLVRPTPTGRTQLHWFLDRLAILLATPLAMEAVIQGRDLTPEAVNQFAMEISFLDRQVGQECRDTARALALYAAEDPALQEIGYDYLLSRHELDPKVRARWGIRSGARPAREVVSEVSHLLALTGATVIAVDQIDALLASEAAASDRTEAVRAVNLLGDGLMSLRELTRRTVTVVSCLAATWERIADSAVATVAGRFRTSRPLRRINDADVARELVARRLAIGYAAVRGFDVPHRTWPVSPGAFVDDLDLTPRALLQAVDAHIRRCLADNQITELASLSDPAATSPVGPAPAPAATAAVPRPRHPPEASPADIQRLDQHFKELCAKASRSRVALDPTTEDDHMPDLLEAALVAWVIENRHLGTELVVEPASHLRPVLHAQLRQIVNPDTGAERRWSLRAIATGNPNAARTRLQSAATMSGVAEGLAGRRLVIIRNDEWPGGPETQTQRVMREVEDKGGMRVGVDPSALATFEALDVMRREGDPFWPAWLVSRRPASATGLLSRALADVSDRPAQPPTPGASSFTHY